MKPGWPEYLFLLVLIAAVVWLWFSETDTPEYYERISDKIGQPIVIHVERGGWTPIGAFRSHVEAQRVCDAMNEQIGLRRAK